ncbi:MAG: penicillin-binding transpeptidase domain-containing protein [Opitutaceae bacterium]
MSIIEAHSSVKPRIAFFYIVVALLVLVLFCGLAYRQIFSSEGFLESERLQNRRRILVPGPRGEIYDREGRVLVANRPRFSAVVFFSDLRPAFLTAERQLVRDVRDGGQPGPPEGLSRGKRLDWYAETARASVLQESLDECGRILGATFMVDRKDLETHYSQQPLLPYPLLDDLAPGEFAKLVEQLPQSSPVQIYSSLTRHYPYGSTAAHTLGYVTSTLDIPTEGLPGSDLMTFFSRGSIGRDGIEKAFDSLLQGQTGSEILVVDPAGFEVELVENKPPVTGNPFYSSIDIDIQSAGENAFGTREGAMVVMNVRTGEVLAMVSRPDYDLNDLTPYISKETFADIEDRGAWINRALQGLYPPGSTFKLVTAIAALRAGTITPETVVDCPGYYMIGRQRFACHRRSGHGRVTLRDALRVSCNVYFYKTAIDLGIEKLAAEARRFGLDHPTGIDLPFETTRMLVPDPAWKMADRSEGWTTGNTAHVGIGQGFLRLTPLQMTCFTASLARGETLTVPTISRREHGHPTVVAGNQSLGLSPGDHRALLEGMEQVVQIGTGRMAAIPGIRLAGKSGTAQVQTPRGMLELAWFLAFGPIEDPEIAVVLVVVGEKEDEANAGGAVAAPIAKQVLDVYFEKHPHAPAEPVVAEAFSSSARH